MPPRLQHKKSRNGCKMCKERRVKCDEKRPSCLKCSRHQVLCEYGPNQGGSKSTSSSPNVSSMNPGSSNGTFDEEILLDPDQRRLLELFLLHHYTTIVAYTFPTAENEPDAGILSNYITDMAFDHPFLLNSIFALAALHLVYLERQSTSKPSKPSRVDRLADILLSAAKPRCQIAPTQAHRIYFNIAAKQQREALANISSRNSNALWMTTIILSLQTLAFARNEACTGVYALPLHWLRMTRGMMEVEAAIKLFARPLTILDFISPEKEDVLGEEIEYGANVVAPKVFEDLLNWERSSGTEPDQSCRHTYENAIRYLRRIYQRAKAERYTEVFRGLLRPDPLTTPQFLRLIECQRPRAIAILAYYYAMTMAVENHWVFQGMAEHEIHGLKSLLPADWTWVMEWPLQVLKAGNIT